MSFRKASRDFKTYYGIDRWRLKRKDALKAGASRESAHSFGTMLKDFFKRGMAGGFFRTFFDGVTGLAHDHSSWVQGRFFKLHRRRSGRRARCEEKIWLKSVPDDLVVEAPFRFQEIDNIGRSVKYKNDGSMLHCVACDVEMPEGSFCWLLACGCRMHRMCADYLQELTGHYVCLEHAGKMKQRSAPPVGWRSVVTIHDQTEAEAYYEAPWRDLRSRQNLPDSADGKKRRARVWGPATEDSTRVTWKGSDKLVKIEQDPPSKHPQRERRPRARSPPPEPETGKPLTPYFRRDEGKT